MQYSQDLIDTPEREIDERRVEYIGFWQRFGALIIDGIIVSVVSGVLNSIIEIVSSGQHHLLLTSLVTFLTYLYYPIMEGTYGATFGKKALGILIVDKAFIQIGYGQAILRNSFRLIIGILGIVISILASLMLQGHIIDIGSDINIWTSSTMLLVGIIAAIGLSDLVFFMLSNKHQALHDSIARTYVVAAKSVQPWGV